MNTIFRTLIFFSLSLLSYQTYAQVSLGANASYLHVLGGSGLSAMGLGIKGDFPLNDKTVITGNVNYHFASSVDNFVYGNASSNQVSPNQIMIDAEETYTFIHANIGAKFYFAGDYENEFGIYAFAEGGLLVVPFKYVLADYDSDNYNVLGNPEETEYLGNFTINGGLGFEKKLSFGYIFLEAKANLPAETYNSRVGYYSEVIPAALNGLVGVRIRL